MTRKELTLSLVFGVLLAGPVVVPVQALASQTEGEPGKTQEQHLEVTVDEATGNYIFRYKAYDGSPIEVVFVPATKIKPEVGVVFSFDAATGLTTYKFQISNGKGSKQELYQLAVKVIPPAENIQTPDGWYVLGPSPPTSVVNWFQMRGGTLVNGLVQPRGLLPGQIQGGFSFQSPNLPGVVRVYLRGNARSWPNPPGVTSQIRRQMRRYTWWENDSVHKTAIGPAIQISDLDPYDPVTHLGRLQSNLVDELARDMIPNQNLQQGVYEKFGQARTALRAERPSEARKHLAAILEQLTYQPETNISVDLVKAIAINVNFVLGRLP